MFRTKFERRVVTTASGDRIKMIKQGKLDAKKNITVVDKAKKDLYSEINSYANSVDIHVLLQRFANGDKEALLQRAGAFIDISAMPTNLNDFIGLYKDGENLFKTLPTEVKEKFNNNMVEFISKIGDKDWMEIMSKSPADYRQEGISSDNAQEKAHKNASRVTYNSVYGDQSETEKPILEPISDPIQEVKKNAL